MTKWIAHYGISVKEIDEIMDFSFRSFLDVCWPYVDYFTFSSCRDDSISEERRYGNFCELKKELTPFFAGRTIRNEWFGYGFSSHKETEMCIYRYKASEEAKEAKEGYPPLRLVGQVYRTLRMNAITNTTNEL